MRIIVDAMPESPEKCKFHGGTVNHVYICKITNKKCPMVDGKTCRVLRELNDCPVTWR